MRQFELSPNALVPSFFLYSASMPMTSLRVSVLLSVRRMLNRKCLA